LIIRIQDIKNFQIHFCGTIDIIESIKIILDNKFGCSTTCSDRYPDRDNNNIQCCVCGNRIVRNILDWLYEDATIYMDRKYNKYLELIEENERVDNDNNLYGNAYPRRQVIRLLDLKIYKTLTGAAKENDVSPAKMYSLCHKRDGFMYLDEYNKTK